MWTLEQLEKQLRTSTRTWERHGASRRKPERMLAEYHKGLAIGIYITLGAAGHRPLQDKFMRELEVADATDQAFLAGLLIGHVFRH